MTSDFCIKPYHWVFTLALALLMHILVLVNIKQEQPQALSNSNIPDNELVISFKKLKQVSVPQHKNSPPQNISKPIAPPIAKKQAVKKKPIIKKPVTRKEVLKKQSVKNDRPKQIIKPKVIPLTKSDDNTNKPKVARTPRQASVHHDRQLEAIDSDVINEKNRYLKELAIWLGKYKKYPSIARRRNLEGDVLIRFVINKDGQLLTHSIVQASAHNSLNKAAINMVKSASPMPKVPAKLVGNKQQFEYTIPIEFSLSKR